MTKTLEDTLNLPSLEEALEKVKEDKEAEVEEQLEEVEHELQELQEDEGDDTLEAITNSLERTESFETALSTMPDSEDHNNEMDDISEKALEAYQQILDLGMDVSPAHAGKIFENAVQLLKISMDARNSKSDNKIKLMKIALDKAKFDRQLRNDANKPEEGSIDSEEVLTMDRNQLLKHLSKK